LKKGEYLMTAVSPDEYVPVDGGGEYRPRLERGLGKKGYRAVWARHDYEGELRFSSLRLVVLNDRYCAVRKASVTFRRDHLCEGAVAEGICERMVEGAGGRYAGEPVLYG
jgi:hypothetical protein